VNATWFAHELDQVWLEDFAAASLFLTIENEPISVILTLTRDLSGDFIS